MIQSLSIQNFQSHKLTKLNFHEGLNIITGTSDSGKTAIIRALRWVTTNKPTGNSFRSKWGGKTEVSILVDDVEITRSKDKQEEYLFGNLDPFHAFKTEVPEEISKHLNLQDINLQSQMDSPFLISSSAGEVASHFNKVARLDKIDTATANVNSWIRELTADIKYKTNQQKELEEKVEKFKYLDKFEIEVEVLEGMESKLKNLRSKGEKLTDLLWKLEEITASIFQESEILKIEPLLNQILSSIEQKDVNDQKRIKLRKFTAQIRETEDRLKNYQNILLIEPLLSKILERKKNLIKMLLDETALKGLVYYLNSNQKVINRQKAIISIEKPVTVLLGLITDKESQLLAIAGLNKAVLSLNNTNTLLKNKVSNLALKSKEFTTSMGDVCILCGQKIKQL